MEHFCTITIVLVGFFLVNAAEDWSYRGEKGPDKWPGVCTKGSRQSPIDIVTEDTTKVDLGSLKFVRYDFAFSGMITNNGHTVQIELNGLPIHLEGANLPSTYTLEQMHFHWGAEHTVDGARDALELHLVHYDNQYENVTMAAQHENGVAVVATLFELSNADNLDLMPIIKATEVVSKWVGESTAEIRSKIIPYLYLPKDKTTYYHYEGSLTTPGCQESVLWFVFSEKLSVSEQQVKVFKSVASSNGTLKFNYRPTQPLADRKVYHHLEGYSSATSLASNLSYTIFGFLLVKVLQSSN